MERYKMNTEKLKQIHEQVKNHPFRLTREDWRGFYELLRQLDKEFSNCLNEYFDNINRTSDKPRRHWDYFIHELRSAIWHFQFEFNEEHGRASCREDKTDIEKGHIYGRVVPEYQKQIVIIMENYIQQIHHFIISQTFEEFITYYLGCDDVYNPNSNGGRWSKYKLNKETNKFEFVGKLK
jgi:hypothetical protein